MDVLVRKYSMQEIFLKESYKKDKENFQKASIQRDGGSNIFVCNKII